MDYSAPVTKTFTHVTERTTASGVDIAIPRPYTRTYPAPLARFLALTEKTDGCWLWQGHVDKRSGYGKFRMLGRTELAHRAAYLMLKGEIPQGRYLDHLCRVRHCVNPDHLEPVTPQTNTDRGLRRKKEECKYGHALTGENRGTRSDGRQYCKQCSRERQAKHQHKSA
jgi:hypothetical protein